MVSTSTREQFDLEESVEELCDTLNVRGAALIAIKDENLRNIFIDSCLCRIKKEKQRHVIARVSCDSYVSFFDLLRAIAQACYEEFRGINQQTTSYSTELIEELKKIKKEYEDLIKKTDERSFKNQLDSLIDKITESSQQYIILILDKFELTDKYFTENNYRTLRTFASKLSLVFSSEKGKGQFENTSVDKYALNNLTTYPF